MGANTLSAEIERTDRRIFSVDLSLAFPFGYVKYCPGIELKQVKRTLFIQMQDAYWPSEAVPAMQRNKSYPSFDWCPLGLPADNKYAPECAKAFN
ncbi:MAG: hypothetical protein WA672_04000, partial [Candidatus Angelobacter sp.]